MTKQDFAVERLVQGVLTKWLLQRNLYCGRKLVMKESITFGGGESPSKVQGEV
jgi:hypothetical protein